MSSPVLLSCLLFDLRHSSTGVYMLLCRTRSWWENGKFWESSWTSILSRASAILASRVSHTWPSSPQETLQDLLLVPAQAYMELLLCAVIPCTWNLICSLQENCLFHSSVELLHSWPTGLQSKMFWGFLLLKPDSQAENPELGLKTFTFIGEPQWYNYFPVCGSPTWWLWELMMWQKCSSCHLVAPSLSWV